MNKVMCEQCAWIGMEDEVLKKRILIDDVLDECPLCGSLESISVIKLVNNEMDQKAFDAYMGVDE